MLKCSLLINESAYKTLSVPSSSSYLTTESMEMVLIRHLTKETKETVFIRYLIKEANAG